MERNIRKEFSFGEAVEQLKKGLKVTRTRWIENNTYLELQTPDEYSKMTMPYIYLATDGINEGTRAVIPAVLSHTDILADDWILVE